MSLGIKINGEINYHSLQNLRDAHSSMTKEFVGDNFFICAGGSEILRSGKGNLAKAKLAIYDSESKRMFPIFLESCQFSSLHIWNSAAYLYFDKNMAKKFSILAKFQGCVMYSDLRETFCMEGKSKGVVVLVPAFSTQPELVNRAVIADEFGIYLIGGSRINRQALAKNPLIETNFCSYFELEQLNNISTKRLGGNNMDSMKYKRDSLVVTQTKNYIFALGGQQSRREKCDFNSDFLPLEVYEKEDGRWNSIILIQKTQNPNTYYSMSVISGDKGYENLLIVENVYGKYSNGLVVDIAGSMGELKKNGIDDIMSTSKNIITRGKLAHAENDSKLIWTGGQSFQIQNSYYFPNVLMVANCTGSVPEVSGYNCLSR